MPGLYHSLTSDSNLRDDVDADAINSSENKITVTAKYALLTFRLLPHFRYPYMAKCFYLARIPEDTICSTVKRVLHCIYNAEGIPTMAKT
ncbi:hypothetical protein VTN00DRAFT_5366 [Thermoascus crustaceus]|uniref:uncharacterized protein n=1 Tax=Thermoascus crustaceus TaxID=5088 RepID=UPI003743F8BF